jgi:hypothetical protein
MTYIPKDNVPAKNSALNTTLGKVIGNKTDDEDGSSLMANSYTLLRHAHSASLLAPASGAGIVLNAHPTNAWVLGTADTIFATNEITAPYDVHFVLFEAFADNGTFEVVFYYDAGAGDVECGRVRTVKTTLDGAPAVTIQTPMIPANAKLSAKMMGSVANKAVTISIQYHTY